MLFCKIEKVTFTNFPNAFYHTIWTVSFYSLAETYFHTFQALYGHKTQTDIGGSVPRATTQAAPSEDPALCADSKIDTIFNSADGNTFIFKGMMLFTVDPNVMTRRMAQSSLAILR